jgi:hypothetical protein
VQQALIASQDNNVIEKSKGAEVDGFVDIESGEVVGTDRQRRFISLTKRERDFTGARIVTPNPRALAIFLRAMP